METYSINKPRILTWNIHGSYLYYLSQGDYIIYVPYNSNYSERYIGRGNTYPYGPNVIEIPANEVRNIEFDIILFQCDENYFIDQYDILSEEQQKLPKIYIEHDPPWEHPTNALHPVRDENVTLVHVTHYNKLMWEAAVHDVRVITHGVKTGETLYRGNLKKGIVVINNLPSRGRMLGYDIFKRVKEEVPLDLVGMGNEEEGAVEVLHPKLMEYISQYRFYFSPIRYTSLGLSTCEAMMIGMPVLGLSTTELPSVIRNGVTGFIDNDIDVLIDKMKLLLALPNLALGMSHSTREHAKSLFGIERFVNDWKKLFIEKLTQNQVHYEKKENSIY